MGFPDTLINLFSLSFVSHLRVMFRAKVRREDTSSTAALFYVALLGSLPQILSDNLGIPSSTMKNSLP